MIWLILLSKINAWREETTVPLPSRNRGNDLIRPLIRNDRPRKISSAHSRRSFIIFSRAEYVCRPLYDISDTPTSGRRTFGRCRVRTGRSCFSDDPGKPDTWSVTIRSFFIIFISKGYFYQKTRSLLENRFTDPSSTITPDVSKNIDFSSSKKFHFGSDFFCNLSIFNIQYPILQ